MRIVFLWKGNQFLQKKKIMDPQHSWPQQLIGLIAIYHFFPIFISIIVQLFWCKSMQGLLRGIFRSEEYLSVSLYVQKIFFFSVEIQSVLNNALSEFCWSHIALAQSQVAGTPCVWKFTFWSFLTKTKQDQAFLSHVHGNIWPHSTQFWVMIFFFYLSLFWAPCTEYNFVFSAEVKRVIC